MSSRLLRQQRLLGRSVGLGHGPEVLVQLLHVLHAGDGRVDVRVLEDPLERREHGAWLLELRRRLGTGTTGRGSRRGARRRSAGTGGRRARRPSVEAARHHLHADDPDAGLARLRDGLPHRLLHREVVHGEDDVHEALLRHQRDQLLVPLVRADAGEADLAPLLGDPLGLEQVVRHVGRRVLQVQVPDVDVVGAELPKARVQIGQRALLVAGDRLGGQDDVLPLALERRADHALVVAAHVDARRVEVVDADVRGTFDDAGVGSRHAAEAHGGDLEARLPEGPVGELDRRSGRLGDRLRRPPRGVRGGSQPGRGYGQPKCQKLASRTIRVHGTSPRERLGERGGPSFGARSGAGGQLRIHLRGPSWWPLARAGVH